MLMVFATSLVVFLFMYYCTYFDDTFTSMLLVYHCCVYTWAIVRLAFIGPLILLWYYHDDEIHRLYDEMVIVKIRLFTRFESTGC